MLGDGAIDNPTAPPIFGILEADTLEIGEFGDRVIGFDGDDVISFAAGEDTTGRDMDVMGGSGDDTITLGLGDDSIEGGLGTDTIYGGGGSDEFYGGYGNDILNSATEQLNIDVSLALDAVPTITYEIAAGGSGTNLLVDGNVVAFLVGVDLSTLNTSNVNVTNTNVTP